MIQKSTPWEDTSETQIQSSLSEQPPPDQCRQSGSLPWTGEADGPARGGAGVRAHRQLPASLLKLPVSPQAFFIRCSCRVGVDSNSSLSPPPRLHSSTLRKDLHPHRPLSTSTSRSTTTTPTIEHSHFHVQLAASIFPLPSSTSFFRPLSPFLRAGSKAPTDALGRFPPSLLILSTSSPASQRPVTTIQITIVTSR